MKKLGDKLGNALAAAAVSIVLVILTLNVVIFHSYRSQLIGLQENHMLTTARSVGNNLETYYKENLNHFSLYFSSPVSGGDAMNFMNQQPEISSVLMVEKGGTVSEVYGIDYRKHMSLVLELYEARKTRDPVLLPPILTKERHFTQFMIVPASWEGKARYAVAAMEMPYTYELIVKPVQIGKNGYSMVKTFEGTILMHKSETQVSLNALEGRREQYKQYNLDLNDLEVWLMEQRKEAYGSRILESYWWEDDKEPVKSRKIVAYTQIPVGEETWIINCTLDYNEIEEPLRQTQRYLFYGSAAIVLGFGVLCFFLIDSRNRSRTMKLEMKHLREMNGAWEALHKREQQLRHQDKIQTLGTMAGMISHEFNNFLTPIMLYGEMIELDDSVSESNRTCLREILEAASKARDLTRELSLYGRMEKEAGKKVIVCVTKEIDRSLGILKKTMPSNIELVCTLESDEGYGLMSGKGMIGQVVVNLCTNAVYAMRPEGGKLTVKGQLIHEEAQTQYGIVVMDTGCGIPEEKLHDIFTPFYTTKEAGEGTGLGLSVVSDLVHQVSGDISVVSHPGTGTRFDILLPLLCLTGKEEGGEEKLHDISGRRVLILDDTEMTAKPLQKSLKGLCSKAVYFCRPEEALDCIKKEVGAWDTIITDYAMPVMNGVEFAGILRSLGFAGQIILISGYLDCDIRWYLDSGIIDAFLEKPVSLEELAEAMTVNS